MPLLRIPPSSLPGLTVVSNFDANQVQHFATFLRETPPGVKMDDIVVFLNREMRVPLKQSEEVVQTLISFRSLLEPSNVNYEELAGKLVSSYVETESNEEKDLKKNLLEIFKNFRNLKLTLKADTLLSHDAAIYSESKVVTDIRIIFNDDLQEKNRNAVLVHNLNIEYYVSNQIKSLNVSMTLSDLKELQEVIERAISKETIIAKDYGADFKFITPINK